MQLPQVDDGLLTKFLVDLLKTPSPTGFTDEAIALIDRVFRNLPGVTTHKLPKGGLLVTLPGEQDAAPRALTAHADTLGAMVKAIKPNGKLLLTAIGGVVWNTVEGEGCIIFNRKGKRIRGSIMINTASIHVFGNRLGETKRDQDNMEVRLDERVTTADQTADLGISVGDFVAFDPRVELTNGFVRSRHLDDKACVACLVEAVRSLTSANLKPVQTTYIYINNYEEMGHFALTDFPVRISELLAVDMAAVGEGQTSDEYHATICVKDSSGPYHHGMSQRLRDLGDLFNIPYHVDIYPTYSSDASAYWRAGGNMPIALIGPGVDASHNYERTHTDALVDTTRWLLAYLLN
ncbi:MAG: peptidase M42 [Anaerolinea sp.]|nr:peptidase M42 [Anaerolinea sp.]